MNNFKDKPENINRKGRPKGSQNKEKIVIKDFINDLINDNKDLLIKDFLELTPNERLKHTINLMKFIIPFAKENEIEIGENEINFTFEVIPAKEIS